MWVFEIASGRFLAVNAEACRHYGYTESEFLDMTIAQIRAPADVAQLEAIRSLQPAGHRALGVWRHRKKNGEVVDVEITSDDIVFEGRVSRLVLAREVTELVRTTLALRERGERFHYVAKATEDAVWDWNLRHDSLWWNGGIERLFGLNASKVATIGAWRAFVHPEDRERVVGSVRIALDDDAEQWTCHYRVLRSDHSYAFVYDRDFVIRDAAGAAVRAAAHQGFSAQHR